MSAALALRAADDNLTQVRRPTPQSQIDAAQRIYENADRAHAEALERLAIVQSGPSQRTIEQATTAVAGAKNMLVKAQTRLGQLQAGPPPDQLAAARNAVQSAQASLAVAQARAAEQADPQRNRTPAVTQAEAQVTALAAELWSVPVYERRFAAIVLLQRHVAELRGSDLTRIEQFLRDARVVELVDPLTTDVLRPLVAGMNGTEAARARQVIARWSVDDDPNLRRAASMM